MATATTDKTFDTDVLNGDLPVLVDFWAPWCGPCRLVGPTIDSIAQKTEGKAKVYKLNVDENPIMAQRYGVFSIPTVLIFKQGRIQQQFVGVQNEGAYLNALLA